jgi:hypothetical protein
MNDPLSHLPTFDARRDWSNGTASRKAQAIVNRLNRENPNATEFEIVEAFNKIVSEDETLRGLEYPDGQATEDWLCVNCGVNTAPGIPDGLTTLQQIEEKGESEARVGEDSEVYMVRDAVWKKAGMEPFGGCLCIGCLERRLGRKLKPKDFIEHPFNGMPGSERLLKRRKYWHIAVD